MFASRAQRRLAIAALALALISAVIAVNAARAHPERRVRTVTVPAPPAAAAVDASGCPMFADCRVRPQAAALAAAFVRAFPHGRVLDVQDTYDLRGNRSYRTSLLGLVSDDASTVSVTAQCVPGAPGSTARQDRSNTASIDLAGNSVIQFRQLSVLVPGRPGCAVAVLLRTRGPAVRFSDAAVALAGDPAVQLPP